jgi:CPA1 family monovalent cation:H+ antiporter
MTHGIDLVILLLLAVVALAAIARRIGLPYPMMLLAVGIGVALVPRMPEVHLDPHLVFVIFLPPVLFEAAYFTSLRDFRANKRPIGLLAVGCVLTTMLVVGLVARQVFDGMSWATALALGAIVSPPDAVAASAIFRRVGAPHRIVTILEGESLVNDATALIAYRFAVAAVVGGTFSLMDASLQFVLVGVGGVALGVACGWLMLRVVPWIDDASLQIGATMVAPAAIYVLAEEVHVSGVLAVVTAGLVFGRNASRSFTLESRLGGFPAWQTGLVLINGLVFILIGLQLGTVLDRNEGESLATLFGQALLISVAVVVARFLWIFPATYVPRWLAPSIRVNDPAPPWQPVFVIGWSGLRGVVSLASALALPLAVDAGGPFPWRDEIVLVTFVVIVVTLLGQGLPLPWILRRLGVQDDGAVSGEVWEARRIAAEAIVARIDELEGEAWVDGHHAAVLRKRYMHTLAEIPESGDDADLDQDHIDAHDRLRADVIDMARVAVIRARNEGRIGDAARFRVETELDREDARTEF